MFCCACIAAACWSFALGRPKPLLRLGDADPCAGSLRSDCAEFLREKRVLEGEDGEDGESAGDLIDAEDNARGEDDRGGDLEFAGRLRERLRGGSEEVSTL